MTPTLATVAVLGRCVSQSGNILPSVADDAVNDLEIRWCGDAAASNQAPSQDFRFLFGECAGSGVLAHRPIQGSQTASPRKVVPRTSRSPSLIRRREAG